MVMKDKITKNGHKGMYYKTRRIALFVCAFIFLSATVAIPTYINVTANKENNVSHAEEDIDVKADLLTYK